MRRYARYMLGATLKYSVQFLPAKIDHVTLGGIHSKRSVMAYLREFENDVSGQFGTPCVSNDLDRGALVRLAGVAFC